MDFERLTRKDLQTLCKKNKIPANITNVAMTQALNALHFVQGIEEFFNPSVESETTQVQSSIESPEKTTVISSSLSAAHRTSCTTHTRTRKPIKQEEPEHPSQTLTSRRRTRSTARQVVEKASNNGIPETPVVYSTRRSVRLSEKKMVGESYNLKEESERVPESIKINSFNNELSEVSEEMGKSSSSGDMKIILEVGSERGDDLELLWGKKSDVMTTSATDLKDDVKEESKADQCEDDDSSANSGEVSEVLDESDNFAAAIDEQAKWLMVDKEANEDDEIDDDNDEGSEIEYAFGSATNENGEELSDVKDMGFKDLHDVHVEIEVLESKGSEIEYAFGSATNENGEELSDVKDMGFKDLHDVHVEIEVLESKGFGDVAVDVFASDTENPNENVGELYDTEVEVDFFLANKDDALSSNTTTQLSKLETVEQSAEGSDVVEFIAPQSSMLPQEDANDHSLPEESVVEGDMVCDDSSSSKGFNVLLLNLSASAAAVHDQKNQDIKSSNLVVVSGEADIGGGLAEEPVIQEELMTLDKTPPASAKKQSSYYLHKQDQITSNWADGLLYEAHVAHLMTPTKKSSSKKTPLKKSVSKTPPTRRMSSSLVSDDDKENIDNNSVRKLVLLSTEKKLKGNKDGLQDNKLKNKSLNDLSLRQLEKMLKEKLQITSTNKMNNNNEEKITKVMEKSRPALQALSENEN